ncbi:hypothetical protein CKF59_06605, partial [Psittacicella gerlachiana]
GANLMITFPSIFFFNLYLLIYTLLKFFYLLLSLILNSPILTLLKHNYLSKATPNLIILII